MSSKQKLKIEDLPEFDIAHYLKSKKAMMEYLNQVIADGDSAAELAAALGRIERAKGMAEVSKSTGLTRESLYKALRPDTKQRFDTVSKVIQALGMRIKIHS